MRTPRLASPILCSCWFGTRNSKKNSRIMNSMAGGGFHVHGKKNLILGRSSNSLSQTGTTGKVLANIRTNLVSVYAKIYVYQIRFILQYVRSTFLRSMRNIVGADDWKQRWNDIESTSRLVDQSTQDIVGARMLEVWKAAIDIKVETEKIKDLQRSTLEVSDPISKGD